MKKHLIIYGILVTLFIVYNAFFQVKDEVLNEILNIIFSSILFLYIAIMAWVLLKKIKKVK
ncbi:hypothetical protein [Bergeyella zoohelcum]|uniref:Uncharacterized protein n=1 Tax=Bergeyella zoohelcum ATCC 43767 TaxID=883096 RepID=K1LZL7_9FLAO|nr:hypothetical protein [Bergeyella zoohelcum]EKB57462.1 hypothetical protein HMPREF9699_00948 [Bergeyella zoohelcum ATCC 43767]MDY6024872.1 hypothetical protein [Bergeyella zoohelcum]SUV48868.1 Uncharacterised protein [Bergeyella zoohelcum]